MKRFETKCINATININENKHFLILEQNCTNVGMFGSKIVKHQFEKIESVLSKRYIKLPFGFRLLI